MILISLVGEQPIPNLIPLWHSRDYEAVQFVATETTQYVAETLAALVQSDPDLRHVQALDTLLLKPYDIQQARQSLAAAIARHQESGKQVRLNLTGGTKLMSLAALQAAYGSGVDLIYVATEINSLIYHRSDMSEYQREPINVSISVSQYLLAHGLEMGSSLAFKKDEGLNATYRPPKQGDALEERVYQEALKSGLFDDVCRNVFILKQTRRGPVINELDVVVTRNGRMAVCSCKSKQQVGSMDMNKFLYELYSLSSREAAGIYCGKVLALATDEVNESGFDRARLMGIQIVPGSQLSFIVNYLDQSIP